MRRDSLKEQALTFRNIPRIKPEYVASVHLEDKEDLEFWDSRIQQIRPGKYHYITHSKSRKGRDSKGCMQCLAYVGYLSKEFFICIDSDLRLLRGEKGLTPHNYIAQTYAYSWENHLCESAHLQQRFVGLCCETDFDFVQFLKELSEIVYRPLLYLIRYNRNPQNKQWNISKFNKCIPLQPRRDELYDNGKEYLRIVKNNFDEALSNLTDIPDENDLLTIENAYLHMQGHQLYNLVMHIGTMLCHNSGIAFRTDVMNKTKHISGYAEMDSLCTDLQTILID